MQVLWDASRTLMYLKWTRKPTTPTISTVQSLPVTVTLYGNRHLADMGCRYFLEYAHGPRGHHRALSRARQDWVGQKVKEGSPGEQASPRSWTIWVTTSGRRWLTDHNSKTMLGRGFKPQACGSVLQQPYKINGIFVMMGKNQSLLKIVKDKLVRSIYESNMVLPGWWGSCVLTV